jgi:cell division protein FtsB
MLSIEEIKLLQAQNEGYRTQNKSLQKENTELKAENERLKEEIKMYKSEDTRKHNVIMETLQCEKKALDVSIKYKETLQEIKKYIAKICKEECGYVQKKRCPDCDCRYGAILDLITKAEEE